MSCLIGACTLKGAAARSRVMLLVIHSGEILAIVIFAFDQTGHIVNGLLAGLSAVLRFQLCQGGSVAKISVGKDLRDRAVDRRG